MDPMDQIDTAGTIVHEMTHQAWYRLGAVYDSKDQEGAAFAAGDMVKRNLCLDVRYVDQASKYDIPFMNTEQRRQLLSTSEVYRWMPDEQIWWSYHSPNDTARVAYGFVSWVINRGFISLADVVSQYP